MNLSNVHNYLKNLQKQVDIIITTTNERRAETNILRDNLNVCAKNLKSQQVELVARLEQAKANRLSTDQVTLLTSQITSN